MGFSQLERDIGSPKEKFWNVWWHSIHFLWKRSKNVSITHSDQPGSLITPKSNNTSRGTIVTSLVTSNDVIVAWEPLCLDKDATITTTLIRHCIKFKSINLIKIRSPHLLPMLYWLFTSCSVGSCQWSTWIHLSIGRIPKSICLSCLLDFVDESLIGQFLIHSCRPLTWSLKEHF
jgi:hypothetical protein